MFYAHFVLSKKGPLARIWLAAHWDKKLTKAHVFETNIEGSVEAIIQPKMKLALRTSGHLLLGVVRIYSRKAKYLLADCNEAFVKIKMAFRPGAVDLPEENREAAMAAITLPEDFHEFETSMADLSDIDVHAQFAVNQSRPEEITMREDLGNITLVGDDGFGDMGFDGSSAMIQDANLDDSLYKNTDGASCFLMDGGTGFQADGTRVDDQPMAVDFDGGPPTHQEDGFASGGDDYEGPPGADDDDDSVTDNFTGEHELFGENFSSEPGGLFEEPPAMVPAVNDSVGPVDPAVSQQKNGMFMSPSRTPRYALSDVTQQQNMAPPVLTNTATGFDHTTLLMDETEAFALEPIDVTAIGSERKVRKKRRLVIDELKSIASETMKLQLSDTSEIVSTLDLAPPTKKLMHWKETGGVEKLFAFPGRQIVSRKLSRLFTSNLVTRSASAENAADAERSIGDVEHTRVVADREMFESSDLNDMPELAPAMQEAYGMPASVAPCIVDDSAVAQPYEHDMSSRVSFDASNSAAVTPRLRPSHASPVHRTPSHLPHASPVKSPDQPFIPNLAPFGGSDDENDDAGDYNDDDGDVSSEAAEDVTLEPVDESQEPVEEGKEAEAEAQRWNRRSQQMLSALSRCLQRHDSVSFRQMAPPSAAQSRKQAAAKFYTFLVLKKMEAVDVTQDEAYGDIMISRGTKFDLLA